MQKINSKIVLSVLVAFLLGTLLGYHNSPAIDRIANVSAKENPTTVNADFSTFWKAWNVINEKYPDAKKIADQDRVYGAIKGLAGSIGDPYTTFFTPDEAKLFEDDTL